MMREKRTGIKVEGPGGGRGVVRGVFRGFAKA
jgi:hypothetical protein